MRRLHFDLRQMGLVVLVTLGTAMAIGSGMRAVGFETPLPLIYLLLVIVAGDAVVTQRLAHRQRLSLTEQFSIRAIELALLIVAVRIVSLAAEQGGLLAAIEPWLRDPLAFFGGRFMEYLVAAIVVWVTATGISNAVLQLEVEPPRAGVRGQEHEERAALQDRAQALASFDRLWMLCLWLALVSAAIALLGTPLLSISSSPAGIWPLLGIVCVLVGGFRLHSQGMLEQLAYGWQVEQAEIQPEVSRRWRRASWLLIAGAAVFGLLLANVIRITPPPPLVPLANLLLAGMVLLLALIIGLFSLLLLPFAWLLSLLTGRGTPPPPAIPEIPPPQIAQQAGERPLLPALIFWACVALLVGLAMLRYLREREDVRALLRRWPGLQRLLDWLGASWSDARAWGALAMDTVRKRLSRPRRRATRRLPARDARGQLRGLYRRMVSAGQQRGVPHPVSQTPFEFRDALREALPPTDDDASGLTSVYITAEYGPKPADSAAVRSARMHWRRLERLFNVAGRRERKAPVVKDARTETQRRKDAKD